MCSVMSGSVHPILKSQLAKGNVVRFLPGPARVGQRLMFSHELMATMQSMVTLQ